MIPQTSIHSPAFSRVLREGEPTTDNGGKPAEVKIPDGMIGKVFHFRKEKIKDESGNELAETFKHPSITIPLPVPTKEEMLAIFSDAARTSEQKFIIDLTLEAFYSQVREQINELRGDGGPEKKVSVNDIDYAKLSIAALANMPASERGSKISDEDVKAFLADYVPVMIAAGFDAKKVTNQANLIEKGLRPVKTDKKVLAAFDILLNKWLASSQNGAEHQEVFEMLTGRIKKWQNKEPANVLDSIT